MQRRSPRFETLEARAATRLRVLQCIREAGEISRGDIARKLESSPATVTAACTALMGAGLVQEAPCNQAENVRLGRPRVLLKIDGKAMLIAGAKVSRHEIQVLIADFVGNEIGTYSAPLERSQTSADKLAAEIVEALRNGCAMLELDPDAIAAFGIGMPGFINGLTGFVHWSSSIVERNVDFKPMLETLLPCPVFIDNDANLVAKAEQLFGSARGLNNFLVVTIEHGVGMGVVLDGELYRGKRGCGAEFGHVKVQFDGAVCQCGQRGCLEAYLGEYALLRDVTVGGNDHGIGSFQDLLDAARTGEGLPHDVLLRASRILGTALAGLVNLFDPELIVLARTRPPIEDRYTRAMTDSLRQNTLSVDAPLPELMIRNLDHTMWAKGAAAHGIEMVSVMKIQELDAQNAA